MNTLKNYVDWKLTHADKTAEANGVPLVMEKCKKNKCMKELMVYGNNSQSVIGVGEPTENLFDKDNLNVIKYSYVVANSWKATEDGVEYTLRGSNTTGYILCEIGLASKYAGKKITFSSPDNYSSNTRVVIRSSAGTVITTGNTPKKSNGVYYSTLNVPDTSYTDEVLVIQLYADDVEVGSVITYSEIMVAVSAAPIPYEPYGKYKIPVYINGSDTNISETKNIIIDEMLSVNDCIDFKLQKVIKSDNTAYEVDCQLPMLTSSTTIIGVDTTLQPSIMYGKYIKRS